MKFIQEICQRIVNPPKLRYSAYDLGSPITAYGRRHDLYAINNRGVNINISYYQSIKRSKDNICVIYLHSMNGSRLQSTVYVEEILKLGLSFCSFDFTGCGNSQGNTISFGANEKYDVETVVKKIKQKFGVKKIILWGRSMGSACAVKYCELMRNQNWFGYRREIIGLILDSCFKSFSRLAVEIGHKHSDFPEFLIKVGYFIIKNTLQEKGRFRVQDLQIEQIVGNIQIPVLFLTSTEDITVNSEHSQVLYKRYGYHIKKLKYIKGTHNQSRDPNYIDQVKVFIQEAILENKSNKKTYSAFDQLRVNRFQNIIQKQRNFQVEGEEPQKQNEECYCSLFPPTPTTFDKYSVEYTVQRRSTEMNVYKQKVRLSKYVSLSPNNNMKSQFQLKNFRSN